MKAKRTLAVLLVAVMLLVPFAVSTCAAGEAIINGPIKTAYTDCEYFNPQGLIITVDGKEIEYSPIDPGFKFVPGLTEKLTTQTAVVDANGIPVKDSEGYPMHTADVAVYYNEVKIGTVTVTVSHVWGDTTYMDNNYHGRYCLGCGIVDEQTFSNHNVSNYIPNDDGGLFVQQTETGKCEDCGGEITRYIAGSEKFDSIFSGNYTETEGTILTYLKLILVGLIQLFVGIK